MDPVNLSPDLPLPLSFLISLPSTVKYVVSLSGFSFLHFWSSSFSSICPSSPPCVCRSSEKMSTTLALEWVHTKTQTHNNTLIAQSLQPNNTHKKNIVWTSLTEKSAVQSVSNWTSFWFKSDTLWTPALPFLCLPTIPIWLLLLSFSSSVPVIVSGVNEESVKDWCLVKIVETECAYVHAFTFSLCVCYRTLRTCQRL